MRLTSRHAHVIASVALLMLLVTTRAQVGVAAQEASATPAAALSGWNAAIVEGACDTAASPRVFELVDVTPYNTDPPVAPEGAPSAAPVFMSQTNLPVKLGDLLAKPHAVEVNRGAVGLACGEIGGVTIVNQLLIGVRPLGGSGISGIVQLVANGDATAITVLLTQSEPSRTVVSDGTGGDNTRAVPALPDPATTPETGATPIPSNSDGTGVMDAPLVCDPSSRDCDGDGSIDAPG